MRFLPPSYARRLARAAGAVAVGAVLGACSFITGVPSVDRVELSVPVTSIAPGEQVQAVARALGGGGNVVTHPRRQVRYSTSDAAIATVDPVSGVITGVASGRVRITATSDDESASVEITVRPIPVRDVVIRQRQPVVRLSSTTVFALDVAVIDTNNQTLGTRRPAAWAVLDQTVATVNAAGIVTPRAVGTTQVIASVDTGLAPAVGQVADTVPLRVTLPPVFAGGIQINPSLPATILPGQTQQYSATLTDSTGATVTGRVVEWRSSDTTVAVVDRTTGLATAVSGGAANARSTSIIARVETVPGDVPVSYSQAAVTLNVAPTPAASVSVSPNPVNLRLGVTTSSIVNVVVRDASGNQLFGRRVRVSGNDATVAQASATETTEPSIQVFARGQGVTTFTLQPLDTAGQPQGAPATLTVNVAP